MATELPYLVTNKRLPDLFAKIQSAGVPEKFTFEFLKKLGFASSNAGYARNPSFFHHETHKTHESSAK